MQTISSTRTPVSSLILDVLKTAERDLSQNAHQWYLGPAGLDPEPHEPKRSVKSSSEWKPRTELGRRLAQIRNEIVASGEKLLTWEEIAEERKERWGGRESR